MRDLLVWARLRMLNKSSVPRERMDFCIWFGLCWFLGIKIGKNGEGCSLALDFYRKNGAGNNPSYQIKGFKLKNEQSDNNSSASPQARFQAISSFP